MALKPRRNPFPNCENVEAIAAGSAEDPAAPSGEWLIRLGSVWRSDHPAVLGRPEWFCPLGEGQVTAKFWPERELGS